MQVRALGGKDPLEKEMAAHSSILAWRIPWTEEPARLHTVCGVARVGHDLVTKQPPYSSPEQDGPSTVVLVNRQPSNLMAEPSVSFLT